MHLFPNRIKMENDCIADAHAKSECHVSVGSLRLVKEESMEVRLDRGNESGSIPAVMIKEEPESESEEYHEESDDEDEDADIADADEEEDDADEADAGNEAADDDEESSHLEGVNAYEEPTEAVEVSKSPVDSEGPNQLSLKSSATMVGGNKQESLIAKSALKKSVTFSMVLPVPVESPRLSTSGCSGAKRPSVESSARESSKKRKIFNSSFVCPNRLAKLSEDDRQRFDTLVRLQKDDLQGAMRAVHIPDFPTRAEIEILLERAKAKPRKPKSSRNAARKNFRKPAPLPFNHGNPSGPWVAVASSMNCVQMLPFPPSYPLVFHQPSTYRR